MFRICPLLCLALAGVVFLPSRSQGQASYTATRNVQIQVGAGASIAQSDETFAYIKGATVYGSIDFKSHFGIEGDFHDTSLIRAAGIGEKSLLLGVRYGFTKHGFHPYVKLQAGLGFISIGPPTLQTETSATYKIYAFGGGVDLRLSHRLNLRIIDLEFQRWPNYSDNGLAPTIGTTGLAYRF